MKRERLSNQSHVRLLSIIVTLIAVIISSGFALFFPVPVQAQETDIYRWLKQPVDDKTFQNYREFFVYNSGLQFEEEFLGSEIIEGIRVEHLSFQSTPGERVYALYYSSNTEVSTASPTVIYLHGGSALGKDLSSSRLRCEVVARAGYSVFAIDMKYYGERTAGLLQSFSSEEKINKLYNEQSTYLDWIIQTTKDIRRAYDFLVETREADPNRIALVGSSRGAVVSIIAGAVEQRFAGIATLHGGHDGHPITHRSPAASTANYIGRISPRSLLMINGERDTIFLKERDVLPLQQLAGEQCQFHWFDAGHGRFAIEEQTALLNWLRDLFKHDLGLPDITPSEAAIH